MEEIKSADHGPSDCVTALLYLYSMHLKALRPLLEEMEEGEYAELEQKFPPLFHLICLVWSHSQHYRQPSRLVVLLQEITNLLIELV